MVTAYKVFTNNGYIVSIMHGATDGNITEAEHQAIMAAIQAKPTAPEGFDYQLTTDLNWELYELPVPEKEEDEEATEADYQTALREMGVAV